MRTTTKAGLLYLTGSLALWVSWVHVETSGLGGLLHMVFTLVLAMPLAAALSTFGVIDSGATLLLGYLANALMLAFCLERRSKSKGAESPVLE